MQHLRDIRTHRILIHPPYAAHDTDNVFENNVAVGSVGKGFWIALCSDRQTDPWTGASYSTANLNFRSFTGNVVHSHETAYFSEAKTFGDPVCLRFFARAGGSRVCPSFWVPVFCVSASCAGLSVLQQGQNIWRCSMLVFTPAIGAHSSALGLGPLSFACLHTHV